MKNRIILPGVNDAPAKAPEIWVPHAHQSAPKAQSAVDALRREIDGQYANAQHERKPHGLVIVNGQEVASTLQCPHCGGHFVSRKGSGIRRTFCLKCQAVTCGNFACDPCRPFAEALERSMGRMF
jgi:ribosomal protein L37AE/L43A